MNTVRRHKALRNPSHIAATVLDELKIESAHDIRDVEKLELIVYDRGAIVKRGPMHSAEARILIAYPRSVITVSDAVGDPRRARFAIAHELGHLEMHRYEPVRPCDAEDLTEWQEGKTGVSLELEANEFAAALLMPETLFRPLISGDPSMDAVRKLAGQFNVSLMATARRYVGFCEDPVAVVWAQGRQIKWFVRNGAFEDYRYFPNVGSVVDESTVAGRIFAGEACPPSPRPVRASAWMEQGGLRDRELMEQCAVLQEYDGVLSLLWVEVSMDDDWDNDWD